MNKKEIKVISKNLYVLLIFFGMLLFFMFNYAYEESSTNEFCESCHVHPQATQSWKIGAHVYNESGVTVNCVDCHLPPSGINKFYAKATTGLRDLYGYVFKDSSDFNWEKMSQREFAVNHVYQEGCLNCHKNLFPPKLTKKGQDAHLYFDQNKEEVMCINCHLETGHYHEKVEEVVVDYSKSGMIYTEAAKVEKFENFIEQIPGTNIDFEMIAIPSGKFLLGSADDKEFKKIDESPAVEVSLSKFWIGKAEITWNEYYAFMKETGTEGRTEDQIIKSRLNNVDVISGPTPPYGDPGQGWGKEDRPAITMTHYAAKKYCEWLSKKTDKKYRLPTEAEWEYSARANSKGEYFFDGNPSDYTSEGFLKSIFGVDTNIINSYCIYKENSLNKTHTPISVKPNSFGLVNMLGNVKEFCSDYYSESIYNTYKNEKEVQNPKGPSSGTEFVIRGGSYLSDAIELRISARDKTNQKTWLRTDPQIPKSLWWYSDSKDVGFRVVCEYSE